MTSGVASRAKLHVLNQPRSESEDRSVIFRRRTESPNVARCASEAPGADGKLRRQRDRALPCAWQNGGSSSGSRAAASDGCASRCSALRDRRRGSR